MTEITITIDDTGLPRRSDSYLALAWHASQATPAPHADKDAGQFAEHIAREIVRRWLYPALPGDPRRRRSYTSSAMSPLQRPSERIARMSGSDTR